MVIQELGSHFDLNKITKSGQAFRFYPAGKEKYVLAAGNRAVMMEILPDGQSGFYTSQEEFDAIWTPYFDLDMDYSRIEERILQAEDPYLLSAFHAGKGIRILRQDPWECLVSFILSQRKNTPAIKKAVDALCRAGGKKIFLTAEDKLMEDHRQDGFFLKELYAFPGPEELAGFTDADWAGLRLGYREKYLRRLAEEAASGKVDLKSLTHLSDQELKDRLLSLYGVGEKVASCVMLYGFHRLSAFPRDVWINRVLDDHYQGKLDLEKFSPYQGVVQQFLFEYARNQEKTKQA